MRAHHPMKGVAFKPMRLKLRKRKIRKESQHMNEDNVREYLEGLAPIAANLKKLIEGSNLSHQELGYLAYAQGYLNAAKSHLVTDKTAQKEDLLSRAITGAYNMGEVPF